MTANPSVKERTIERMVFTFMVCQTQSNLKEPPPFFIINEKGNIYKGLKRGTITSENGIIIDADTFEYNKVANI